MVSGEREEAWRQDAEIEERFIAESAMENIASLLRLRLPIAGRVGMMVLDGKQAA